MLIVEGDGRGLAPVGESDDGGGMGLINMRERAALVGGRLEIESVDGHGTAIYVRIPRSEPAA